MKQFYYNVLVEKEDLADRIEDLAYLKKALHQNKKIVIYAPRRYGKSSISKNILPKELKTKNFIAIYCDFMGVKTSTDVAFRLSKGLAEGMEEYIPSKHLFELAKKIVKNLSFSFDTNPITGEASFGLSVKKDQVHSISDLLKVFLQLTKIYKCLFIFDEFQDILDVEDSLSLMRSDLQKLKDSPVLFLGSKRRLLSQIFTSNQSPFFNFADEYVLKPIPIEAWVNYFSDRLDFVKTKISKEGLQQVCELSLNVPNTICEIGSYLQAKCKNEVIDEIQVRKLVDELVTAKSESFYYQLKQLSESEKKILTALAINVFTSKIQSKDFQSKTTLSLSGIKKSITKLYNNGLIEEEQNSYRISNPLFRLFLLKNPTK
jgi:AAA+ ATPase superfamily predicted ATPase